MATDYVDKVRTKGSDGLAIETPICVSAENVVNVPSMSGGNDNLEDALALIYNGKAATNHASSNTNYGRGTYNKYGHVKVIETTSETTFAVNAGEAASPGFVKDYVTEHMPAASTSQKGVVQLSNGINMLSPETDIDRAITPYGLYKTTSIPFNNDSLQNQTAFYDGSEDGIYYIYKKGFYFTLNNENTTVIYAQGELNDKIILDVQAGAFSSNNKSYSTSFDNENDYKIKITTAPTSSSGQQPLTLKFNTAITAKGWCIVTYTLVSDLPSI